jgi:predicted amidohydrolase
MKVAAIQHDVVWEDGAATRARLAPMIAAAAGAGARLIVLTEMFPVGFTMRPEALAEPVDGPSAEFLHESAQAHSVWVCGSIPTQPGRGISGSASGKAVNRLLLVAPDGTRHHYDKIHPFTYGGEAEHYDGGTSFLTVDIEGLKTSFFICYDLRFANEFWALAPGTDCYVIPANWPESRRAHWQSLLSARAIENQAYVVGVNRVGEGGGLTYCGDSRIIDPLGEVIASGARTEALLVAEVDPAMVTATRDRFRFLQDRRP